MEDTNTLTKQFLDLATQSWNPDNFSELLELFKTEYPDVVKEWEYNKSQPTK